MDTLWQDIRYGGRMLFKSPGVSIVATVALALGIGANTAIFSVVNAVLLQPLPYAHPEQLMRLFETDTRLGPGRGSVSYPNFFDWQTQNHVFDKMAAYHDNDFMLTGRGDPARLQGQIVTADLFRILGIAPALGRDFTPDEDKPSAGGRVVILSQALFRSRFNSDASIINHPITLNNNIYTVIGVMPSGFQFPIQNEPVDLWTTIVDDASGNSPVTAARGAHFLRVIARLKPAVSSAQAQAEMNTISARLSQQYPDQDAYAGVNIVPALQALVGDIRPALLILMGAVALVLLIACSNVANLLLARAMARHKEMAIRTALGASRWRVVRQLLTESVLLSLIGGALGLLLAVWWSDLLISLDQANIPRALQVGLDLRVLGFTIVVSLITGFVFGLLPALHSTKTSLNESLKEGRGAGESSYRNRLRSSLVVTEISVAVILLIGAGLLIQSLWRLHHVNPGFEPHNVLTFTVALPDVRYSGEQQAKFFHDLDERIKPLPGVQSASSVMPLPLSGDRFSISFQIEGQPVARSDEPNADYFGVGTDYFRTMGIPIIKGRDFNDHDQHRSAQVIIINQTFAKKYFPNEDPIGKRIQPGLSTYDNEKSQMREVVGIAGDVRNRSLSSESRPAYYIPITQAPFDEMTLVVKTSTDPNSLILAVQREVKAMDAELPVFAIKNLENYVSESVSTPRFNTTLLAIFAGVALVLTIIGLYGVMSYSVAQRTHEIGIRMALGAQQRDVTAMIVKQGLILIVLGLTVGVTGALGLTKLISSLLFGVPSRDLLTFSAAALLLTLVALLACYLPARRATKVDPLIALRYE